MKRNFAVLGGDQRQLRLAELLCRDGHHISLWGFDRADLPQSSGAAAGGAAAVLLDGRGTRWASCGLGAVVLGVALAAACTVSKTADALLRPLMTVVKSTPVASFVVLALIWIARDWLPVFIALLMVLPVVWSNVCTGIRSADPALLELARVYSWPRGRVLRRIYVPSVRPHFLAALRSGLGFGWKAGIAAEVLTVPHSAIGRMIYESKLYLQTIDLFAWTLAVILLSVGLERLVLRALTPRGKGGGGT